MQAAMQREQLSAEQAQHQLEVIFKKATSSNTNQSRAGNFAHEWALMEVEKQPLLVNLLTIWSIKVKSFACLQDTFRAAATDQLGVGLTAHRSRCPHWS